MVITWNLGLALALAMPVASDSGCCSAEPVPTTLTALRKNPEAFRNVWVTFPVQFASMGKVSNPFFTRFVPSEYANFHAWGGEQAIWRKPEYDNAFGLLFLSKGSQHLDRLFQLKLYDRVRCKAIVRDAFQGQPWVEVVELERLPHKVNTATLSHIYRGEQHMAKGKWNRAISELSLAPMASIPATVKASVHGSLGECYLKIGESAAAIKQLDMAMALLGDETTAGIRRLHAAAKIGPAAEIDRRVNRRSIKDHERPMWEAFEPAVALKSTTTGKEENPKSGPGGPTHPAQTTTPSSSR